MCSTAPTGVLESIALAFGFDNVAAACQPVQCGAGDRWFSGHTGIEKTAVASFWPNSHLLGDSPHGDRLVQIAIQPAIIENPLRIVHTQASRLDCLKVNTPVNPYKEWLGIAAEGRRLDYFQLLGLSHDVGDPASIKAAAREQIAKLKPYERSDDAEVCRKLQEQIKTAYRVLSNETARQAYLARLKAAGPRHTATTADSVTPSSHEPALRDEAGGERQHGADHNPTTTVAGRRKNVLAASLAAVVMVIAVSIALLSTLDDHDGGASVAAIDESPASPVAAVVVDESARPSPDAADPLDEADDDDLFLSTDEFDPDSVTAVDSETRQTVVEQEKSRAAPAAVAAPVDPSPSSNIDLKIGDETPVTTTGDVVAKANDVLKTHCSRCHGGGEAGEGGFDFVLDRDKLVSSGYVLPRTPNQSPLYERLVSTDAPMPPEGEQPRPDVADVAAVRDWIRAGAEPFVQQPRLPFVSREQQYEAIASDLDGVRPRERPYMRYFSTTHLGNAGYSPVELQSYRQALAKLLNSLSWNRSLAGLRQLKTCPTVYRVDLRDLKWTNEQWDQVVAAYPYAVDVATRHSVQTKAETETDVPVVRADWFIATASRPPLYHDLLQLPGSDRDLESMLQVNVRKNVEDGRVDRAGFARSGVSQSNRLIERHESIFGAYWKSYDFAAEGDRKSLFEFPLGPGDSVDNFQHDGGEIIFRLPNGLLGFMLVDALGRRIDKGPAAIVSDPRQPDRAVVNGVSCMSCHYGGFIPKQDEIRAHVIANKRAFRKFAEILELYPERAEMDELLAGDAQEYQQILASREIGITSPSRTSEPIQLASSRYLGEVDLQLAAAELGLQADALQARLDAVGDAALLRRIGPLRTPGGVVPRELFAEDFLGLITHLGLGQEAVVDAAGQGKHAPGRQAAQAPGPGRDNRGRPVAAEEALRDGLQAAQDEDWPLARHRLEQAIALAPDDSFKLRAYEAVIPVYERLDALEGLIEGHKFILDAARSSASIKRAHDDFFRSVIVVLQNRNDKWHACRNLDNTGRPN